MRKSRFSDEQIIAILAEQERGLTTAEVCRRHGVSEGTFYKWKAKFGGMQLSDAKKLKTLDASAIELCRENPVPRDRARPFAVGTIARRAGTPETPPNEAHQPRTRCTASCSKRSHRAEYRRTRIGSGDIRMTLMHDPG